EVVEAVEAGFVSVAEFEAHGVVADDFPAEHGDAGELPGAVAAVLVAEDVALADVFGAGRAGAQQLGGEIGLRAVVPEDGDFGADELDVGGLLHGRSGNLADAGARAEVKKSAAGFGWTVRRGPRKVGVSRLFICSFTPSSFICVPT